MLKKISLALCLLIIPMTSQATLISHFGYERDSSSNIVTGDGLEWLMWDVTKGMSINQALASFEDDGWTLATNDNMATLFNTFQFGKSDWSYGVLHHDEGIFTRWSPDDGAHTYFLELFGITSQSSCMGPGGFRCYLPGESHRLASALYGTSYEGRVGYQIASVTHQGRYRDNDGPIQYGDSAAALHFKECCSVNFYADHTGVALVRVNDTIANPVPSPASIGLFTLGLFALTFRLIQRRK